MMLPNLLVTHRSTENRGIYEARQVIPWQTLTPAICNRTAKWGYYGIFVRGPQDEAILRFVIPSDAFTQALASRIPIPYSRVVERSRAQQTSLRTDTANRRR